MDKQAIKWIMAIAFVAGALASTIALLMFRTCGWLTTSNDWLVPAASTLLTTLVAVVFAVFYPED